MCRIFIELFYAFNLHKQVRTCSVKAGPGIKPPTLHLLDNNIQIGNRWHSFNSTNDYYFCNVNKIIQLQTAGCFVKSCGKQICAYSSISWAILAYLMRKRQQAPHTAIMSSAAQTICLCWHESEWSSFYWKQTVGVLQQQQQSVREVHFKFKATETYYMVLICLCVICIKNHLPERLESLWGSGHNLVKCKWMMCLHKPRAPQCSS